MKKKRVKKYRLTKKAQTLYAVLSATAFCLLVGVSAAEFTFGSIVFIGVTLAIFGVCGYMLTAYGREK